MFTTKKDVDQHVRSALVKLKSENEKKLRGFTIAKLYYKINEFETARHYISNYLSIKEDCAPAYKLLGQCYQQLKKPQKALESFQRSLQLDSKQPDLLIEVCELLLSDNNINANKAKYWCDLAESEKVQHDAVLSLRLKLLNKDNLEHKQVEELILKEIQARPNDPNLKVRLIKHFIDKNKISEAFKYAYDQEIKSHDLFSNCSGWYNVVWLALNKYEHQSNANKSWEFWLLLIICLERQIEISFSIMNGGTVTETANLLFNFDQYMFEASQTVHSLFPEKEFAEKFLNHFKGQLCLYTASLIFKREQTQNKNQWKDSAKNALPFLLFAFQCGAPDAQDPWLKHCEDKTKQIIQLWNREGAFRCSQAGRTLLSCIRDGGSKDNLSVSSKVHQIITEKNFWTNSDDLLSQVRSFCSDTSWRSKIFRILFANSDQIRKMSTSFLINSRELIEPIYELPSYANVETYEEIAQYLKPQSLQHMVYLCLGLDNLSDVRCKYYNGLNFSTQNLNFCSSESLNQLDVETFLYATVIQAKRQLQIEKTLNENYNSINIGKPIILPFVNMTGSLCTEEQNNWWQCAYQVYKNLATTNGDNLSEIRATLQYGIEAVRGVNGPKMDLIIILKLGKILMDRCQDTIKAIEKNYLEARTETLFKHALNMYKLHTKGILEPFRKLFKYSNSQNSNVENEIIELAEDAVTYLAARYFKNDKYEECIEEFSGVQLPFATYFQAEAYKKLDESNKTPRKTKKLYLDKARDCLNQTVNLLNYPNINSNHPLNSIINSEIKRLQFIRQISSENLNNGHFSASITDNSNRELFYNSTTTDIENSTHGRGILSDMSSNRRESFTITSTTPKLSELENLVKQIATTLTFVKEELVDMIKPEVKDTRRELSEFKSGIKTELNDFKSGIKTELNELRDKLLLIEESMKKRSQTPSRDDASHVLEDLYLIGDEFQNQVYQNQGNLFPGYVQPPPQQSAQRIHTPSVHHPQSATSSWYSSEYFTQPQYMPFNAVAAAAATADRQHSSFNQRLPFTDTSSTPINFNMPLPPAAVAPVIPTPHQQTLVSSHQIDNRTNMFSMLNQQSANSQSVPKNLVQPPPSAGNVQTIKNTSPAFWNRLSNNAPVEKGPPVNVVITSSDPLPTTNIGAFSQPTLSVTIPPQHIKTNFIPNVEVTNTGSFSTMQQQQIYSNTGFPIMTQSFPIIPANSTSLTAASGSDGSAVASLATTAVNGGIVSSKEVTAINELNKTIDSNDDEDKTTENNTEYDPRPDFKPIIPLPDEIEVKTGEENEDVLFCSRAKLFRHIDKEWKERGVGDIKILKSKADGRIRILMRRDQTHKICANHFITGEMNLLPFKNEEKSYIWAAKDYADEKEMCETLCVRFKQVENAKEFYNVFNKAKDEMKKCNFNNVNANNAEKTSNIKVATTTSAAEITNNLQQPTTTTTTNALSKSSTIFNFNSNLMTQQNKNNVAENPPVTNINSSNAFKTGSNGESLFNTTTTSTTSKSIFTITNTGENTKQEFGKNKATNEKDNSNKSSPFAGFTFDTKTISNNTITSNKPFANLFANFPSSSSNDNNTVIQSKPFPNVTVTSTPAATLMNNTSTSLNKTNSTATANDEDDDFVPTAEFKPVIPLPDLVEVQTGEENEIILFEHRAKLFRFDKSQSQWKERGIGNIKLLVEKQNSNRVRLLMRREQVLKVCINLRLTKDVQFKLTPNNPNSLQFGGKDYSDDNDGKLELFTIRFKTADICKNFHEAILKAQSNMTAIDDAKIVNDNVGKNKMNPPKQKEVLESNATNQTRNASVSNVTDQQQNEKGFGDQFKPKIGSWSCGTCYISNSANTLYCVACETPKDETVPKKPPKNIFEVSDKSKSDGTNKFSTFKFGFGGGNVDVSASVETSKPTATMTTSTAKTEGLSNFDDKFKPKPGSWDCETCYLSNESNVSICVACKTPKGDASEKDNADTTQQKKSIFQRTTKPTFTFGIQNVAAVKPLNIATAVDLTNQQQQQQQQPFKFGVNFGTSNNSIVGGDKQKPSIFTFVPKNTTNTNNIENSTTTTTTPGSFNAFSFSTAPSTLIFGNNVDTSNSTFDDKTVSTTTSSSSSKPVFSFSIPNKNNASIAATTVEHSSSNDNNVEFKLEKKEFNFVLKPKSPGKVKSPLKNNTSGCEDESDNENVEEENGAYFTPVIPLPDKIEVKTGEEDEDVLYCHRAKLYKFTNSEWKERGLGDVKILRHKQSKKLRVVMRREQVLKICLNHVLNEDVEYIRKDEKSWHFAVKDFSEGELELVLFCIRFKTKEIAEEFMKAVKKSIIGENDDNNCNEMKKDMEEEKIKDETDKKNTDNTNDEKIKSDQKLAEKLLLPLNFFETTENHENCKGCRGCDPDKFIFPEYEDKKSANIEDNTKPLPLEMSGLDIIKKINDNKGETSILKQSSFSPNQQQLKPKESNSNESNKKSVFDNMGGLFGKASTNVFSLGDNINLGSTFFNANGQKSIFGGNTMSSNAFNSEKIDTPAPIFGSNVFTKPPNLPSATTITSIDKSQPQQQQQKKTIFGEFSFNKSLNTTDNSMQFTFGSKGFENAGKTFNINQTNPSNTISPATNKNEELKATTTAPENIFKDPGISFSDLATMSSGFRVSEKSQSSFTSPPGGFIGLTQNDAFKNFSNPQFQKANDKIETKSPASANLNCSTGGNGADDGSKTNTSDTNDDANYDPHYDPIIELPKEIEVTTGEENEEKLFGERALLYRYDSETKAWKERGVGELKILHHPANRTYRLILRREQIYKLVLNHIITADFSMKPMNNSGKAFCWAAQNYAEEPAWEKLACRFKHVETGERFENEINKCINQLKKHADLEPEED